MTVVRLPSLAGSQNIWNPCIIVAISLNKNTVSSKYTPMLCVTVKVASPHIFSIDVHLHSKLLLRPP